MRSWTRASRFVYPALIVELTDVGEPERDEDGDARSQALEAQLVAANEEIDILRRALAQREEEIVDVETEELLVEQAGSVFGGMSPLEAESPTHASALPPGKFAARWIAATYCFVASIVAILLPIVARDITGRWLVIDICCALGSGFLGIGLMRNFRLAGSIAAYLASAVTIVLAVQVLFY